MEFVNVPSSKEPSKPSAGFDHHVVLCPTRSATESVLVRTESASGIPEQSVGPQARQRTSEDAP